MTIGISRTGLRNDITPEKYLLRCQLDNGHESEKSHKEKNGGEVFIKYFRGLFTFVPFILYSAGG